MSKPDRAKCYECGATVLTTIKGAFRIHSRGYSRSEPYLDDPCPGSGMPVDPCSEIGHEPTRGSITNHAKVRSPGDKITIERKCRWCSIDMSTVIYA